MVVGFIQSPPTLAVYDVAHSLPLGGAGGGFPFIDDETRRHFSYVSGIRSDKSYGRKIFEIFAHSLQYKFCSVVYLYSEFLMQIDIFSR